MAAIVLAGLPPRIQARTAGRRQWRSDEVNQLELTASPSLRAWRPARPLGEHVAVIANMWSDDW